MTYLLFFPLCCIKTNCLQNKEVELNYKLIYIFFVLQDLGVRIPRPLGNGPSRFIPEKEVGDVSNRSRILDIRYKRTQKQTMPFVF